MKNTFTLFFTILIATNIFASKHNHSDENEVRYIKENMVLNPQYQEFLRNGHLWQNFRANYPDWFVIFNERNQLPHRAFGSPILINDLESFLGANNFTLPNDLREFSSVRNDKYINKTYVQYYNNLEVIGSKLYAKFTLDNELITFGMDVFDLSLIHISEPTRPY